MVADFTSTQNYLSELKHLALEEEIGEDATSSDPVLRALVIFKNAASRGLGPSGKTPEVDWDGVSPDSEDVEGLNAGELRDPPFRSLRVACGWLPREIEAADATLSDVAPHGDTTVAGLRLPASKSDRAGKGGARLRRCGHAQDGAGQAPCAVRARKKKQVTALEQRHGLSHDAPEAKEIPLFPTGSGDVPLKEATTAAWGSWATSTRRPRSIPQGGRRPSG